MSVSVASSSSVERQSATSAASFRYGIFRSAIAPEYQTVGSARRSGAGRVQRHGRANESLQCLLVNLLALVEIDRTPGVAIEAGVEKHLAPPVAQLLDPLVYQPRWRLSFH